MPVPMLSPSLCEVRCSLALWSQDISTWPPRGSATESQIRRAFHTKAASCSRFSHSPRFLPETPEALQWHPDKCNAPDAAEQFRRVNEAGGVDPPRRRATS